MFGSDEEEEDEEVKGHHIENYHRKGKQIHFEYSGHLHMAAIFMCIWLECFVLPVFPAPQPRKTCSNFLKLTFSSKDLLFLTNTALT